MKVLCIGEASTFISWVDSTMRRAFPDQVTLAAYTSAEGLSMVSAHVPDVVILGPGNLDTPMRGVIKEIRDLLTVPLIVMSYDWGDEEAVSALEAGADDYVRWYRIFEQLAKREFRS